MIDRPSATVLSVFSGAGGMDVGLEAAGFRTVGVVEIDPIAAATLRSNRPDWPHLGGGDVLQAAESLTPSCLGLSVGELDLLAGGPPCQPFSLAAQWAASGRRGMGDPRAQTVHATMQLVRKFLPKAVLMENVLGFVQGKNSAIDFLEDAFAEISRDSPYSYRLEWRLINAAHYGVPQNRRRVIIIALRNELEFQWPAPTHEARPISAWDAIGDLRENINPRSAGRWAKLLPSIPAGSNYQWLTSRGGGDEVFGYRTRYWNFLLKLQPDEPAWTLSASPGPATGPFHWEDRHLTVREQMRLQSFPDSWQLLGDERQKVKQVGNATPPLLAEVLGTSLLASLGYASHWPPTLSRKPSAAKLPEIPDPRPVDASYHSLIGPKTAHAGTGRGPAPRAIPVAQNPDLSVPLE